ncbi:MAG TPA: zinc ABC transporter substrate-binding protein [Geminicoccaceae bacterium]|nr:zinc ABC transporter substrate-binding protein [Geminicoccaceae bacterium]
MARRSFRRAALAVALAVGSASEALAAGEPPAVVASIQPIHSLAAAVMEGVAEPRLLVAGGASPHTYQMRPSDAQALARADLVFWVGEGLETFLARPLATLGARARTIDLMAADGVLLLPTRAGGGWEPHGHAEDDHEGEGNGHEHRHAAAEHAHDHGSGEDDAHVWLSPANARAILRAMAAALAEADPTNAPRYEANLAGVTERVHALERELRAQLAPVRSKPYIVFHDAYQYLEHAFGLNAVGSITSTPDRPPSAARIAALRDKLARDGAVCVFGEPQVRSALVATLVEGTRAGTGELDAEGSTRIEPGPEAWFRLMRDNARALVDCLSRAS